MIIEYGWEYAETKKEYPLWLWKELLPESVSWVAENYEGVPIMNRLTMFINYLRGSYSDSEIANIINDGDTKKYAPPNFSLEINIIDDNTLQIKDFHNNESVELISKEKLRRPFFSTAKSTQPLLSNNIIHIN